MTQAAAAVYGIGAVLDLLRPEYPDLTVSKIRFLEAEGLIRPSRSASGYRKFDGEDLGRLRYILASQRDNFLPLRVIKDNLTALDRGLEPRSAAAGPRVPTRSDHQVATAADFAPRATTLRISRKELIAESGLPDDTLTSLESYGVIKSIASPGGSPHYDADGLEIAGVVAQMGSYGIEPRHLRQFKVAADREVGLVAQVVSPLARGRDASGRDRAAELSADLAALSVRLHVALVRAGLTDTIITT